MADIVLAALNAKYIHPAFGLRYLMANLGDLRPHTVLLEFDLNRRPVDIVEAILQHQPRIVGLGIYIWNATPATEVVRLLKCLRPQLKVVLGGPEVSYETETQPIAQTADHVICGEADLAFAQLARCLLQGQNPPRRILQAPLPALHQLNLPYDEYTDEDLAHRILYVEASRGCPFSCEFCLSSLDIPVRTFPLEPFLAALQRLLDRGARHFKFVDRTFNLNVNVARAILEFLLRRHRDGRFYHFEMIPDRLPGELREVIRQFPPGSLQFEVGIQTFNPEVAARISRRQNYARLEENLRWLREHTGVHIHADLIAGLPGESVESFAAGFDRLVALRPHEIQFGILKRLRGTPIVRHDAEWGMVYNPLPPYEILENRLIDFATMQRLRRFARYWDLVANSGNFVETTPRIWTPNRSPFYSFLDWSDWLYARAQRTDAIALPRLAQWLFQYLTTVRGQDPHEVAATLARDFARAGHRDLPPAIRALLPAKPDPCEPAVPSAPIPRRQARHLPRPTPATPTPSQLPHTQADTEN
ncbi:DUF4080 domain-containing protein [Limisphaera ngatamarikiensis]|uniref:DUF4080 domain-containing protein n=1 Tax=Limisphaera ngatamarikiensis TaxID=1324935 RepID=A0A6M1RTW6_9BACT|nr:B12-binding domain-containing radical SAM protein [Limisphaera ngatamarikiensis]NGO38831.1 DUF4080 domain-containing protein [Limisphaera ngatamarikiensis]